MNYRTHFQLKLYFKFVFKECIDIFSHLCRIELGKKGIGAIVPIFLKLCPPLLLSLSTLNLVFWVGKRALLPTQITKFRTRIA